MNLEEIEKLPDILPTTMLEIMFQEALLEFEEKKVDKRVLLLILSQLTDRQVMTYELLESNTRTQVDKILCSLWNTDSYEEVDIMLSIIVNLGLENCFSEVKKSINQNRNIDELILNEVLETIEEVGENISNPYNGLERFK
ncbi:hypothetical protein NQ117_10270 [Paenibacillus sp. SC116]|uniref:hypothetical protein n=1 Tax=Paenibacillus sp. SC116 TaxID=2968986 RepID=UPI00215AE94B|nr:hypothetical protein [Paenibacillus sp. SC116]MCR8844070.1 hypothetical protein [Paenibacillus sp. SC116]